MKRLFLSLLLVAVGAIYVQAIDTVVLASGDSLSVQVTELADDYIYYSYPNEDLRTKLSLTEVKYIRLGSGRVVQGKGIAIDKTFLIDERHEDWLTRFNRQHKHLELFNMSYQTIQHLDVRIVFSRKALELLDQEKLPMLRESFINGFKAGEAQYGIKKDIISEEAKLMFIVNVTRIDPDDGEIYGVFEIANKDGGVVRSRYFNEQGSRGGREMTAYINYVMKSISYQIGAEYTSIFNKELKREAKEANQNEH